MDNVWFPDIDYFVSNLQVHFLSRSVLVLAIPWMVFQNDVQLYLISRFFIFHPWQEQNKCIYFRFFITVTTASTYIYLQRTREIQ